MQRTPRASAGIDAARAARRQRAHRGTRPASAGRLLRYSSRPVFTCACMRSMPSTCATILPSRPGRDVHAQAHPAQATRSDGSADPSPRRNRHLYFGVLVPKVPPRDIICAGAAAPPAATLGKSKPTTAFRVYCCGETRQPVDGAALPAADTHEGISSRPHQRVGDVMQRRKLIKAAPEILVDRAAELMAANHLLRRRSGRGRGQLLHPEADGVPGCEGAGDVRASLQ